MPGLPGEDAALAEKVFAAEKRLALLRLLIIVANSAVYLALLDEPRAVPWLARAIIVVASVYAAYVILAEPYRRFRLLLSSYFTSLTDSTLIVLWVYATGGAASPFYVLFYISIGAIAFRYSLRETVLAALLYAASYWTLLFLVGEVGGHFAHLLVRTLYIGFAAMLGAMMSSELLAQTAAKIDATERLRHETEAERRRAAFLADASKALAGSLDRDTTLRSLARLAVPTLADDVAVVEPDGAGGLRWVATASVEEPASPDGAADLAMTGALRERVATASRRALTAGETVREVDAGAALLAVPLEIRDEASGVLTFARRRADRRYDGEDVLLAEELARRGSLALDNVRLYQEAREAVQLRDTFLGVASHELKTPITSLLLQAEGLLRLAAKGRDLAPDQLQTRLERVRDQARRMERLILQLLDVSRIAAGRMALDRQEVDLGALVSDVVARFDDAREGGRLPIVVDVREVVKGRWDRLRLDEVVTNLVSNACKYGAGKPVEVVVALATGGARALLRVTDHGIGIAPADLGRLFKRFERLVPERSYAGFGLGLWITRQMVEAHGGTIDVASVPGEGSTFTVELPLAEPRPPDRA